MPSNKGSAVAIVLVIILVVLIGGYFLWNKKPVDLIPIADVSNNQVPIAISEPVTTMPVNKNCGTTHFAALTQETPQDIAALDCFSQAIINCQPATLDTGQNDPNGHNITVAGKSGNDCTIISRMSLHPHKKCDVSVAIINYVKTYVEKSNTPRPSEDLVVSILKSMETEKGKNGIASTPIAISCQPI